MHVQVKLFSRFRDVLPREAHGEASLDLPAGATLERLLAHLGIAEPVKLLTVNGQREGSLQRPLAEGDLVYIFPPVVGG